MGCIFSLLAPQKPISRPLAVDFNIVKAHVDEHIKQQHEIIKKHGAAKCRRARQQWILDLEFHMFNRTNTFQERTRYAELIDELDKLDAAQESHEARIDRRE